MCLNRMNLVTTGQIGQEDIRDLRTVSYSKENNTLMIQNQYMIF